jgi:hypothetical protein
VVGRHPGAASQARLIKLPVHLLQFAPPALTVMVSASAAASTSRSIRRSVVFEVEILGVGLGQPLAELMNPALRCENPSAKPDVLKSHALAGSCKNTSAAPPPHTV